MGGIYYVTEEGRSLSEQKSFHQGLKDEAEFSSKGLRGVDAVVRGQFKGLVRGTRNISPDPSALR